MDEYRKRFWDTFEQMQEDFDRFFDHYARAKRPAFLSYRAHWSPPCNIYDGGDCLRVLVEIAGMRRDGIEVQVEEHRLLISGSRAEPDPAEHCNYQQMEIDFGEFALEAPLAVPVDAEAAQAWYHDGFLHIVLPKIPAPKPWHITLSVPER